MILLIHLLLLCSIESGYLCPICIETIKMMQQTTIGLVPEMMVRDMVAALCERQFDSRELCSQVSYEMSPLAITAVIKSILKEGRICEYYCTNYETIDENLIDQLLGQPETIALKIHNHYISNLKLLHFADIHLDLNYTFNASIICPYPICCHPEHGFPKSDYLRSSIYGEKQCDTSLPLFASALNFITDEIELVILTGDQTAHNEWEKSKSSILETNSVVESMIKARFKQASIITIPGNNECLPDHQCFLEYINESISLHHIYSKSNNQIKAFSIITINTLLCDNLNMNLILDQTTAIKQLQLLNTVLTNEENVYIVGHISPYSKACASSYREIFRKIISKHKHKIFGQFYGHTHSDQFFINTESGQLTSFAFVSGSLTPLNTGLSTFRIYQFASNYRLKDYIDYEKQLSSFWTVKYRFKNTYDLERFENIDLITIKNLQENIEQSKTMKEKYSLNGIYRINYQYYCSIYDENKESNECARITNFRFKIMEILEFLQFKWGYYK